jgi:hypothetical protein
MNPDSSVVFNKPELAESAQEGVDTRSRTANHARKSFLGDRLNQSIVFLRLAVLSQQEKQSRQSLFRPVEELIDQIRLCPQVAIEQERREQIGKILFFAHNPEKLWSLNSERGTCGNGCCRCYAQPRFCGHRFLTEKVVCRDQANCGFFSGRRDNRYLSATLVQVEYAIGSISLIKEDLRAVQLDDPSPRPGVLQISINVKSGFAHICQWRGRFSQVSGRAKS